MQALADAFDLFTAGFGTFVEVVGELFLVDACNFFQSGEGEVVFVVFQKTLDVEFPFDFVFAAQGCRLLVGRVFFQDAYCMFHVFFYGFDAFACGINAVAVFGEGIVEIF